MLNKVQTINIVRNHTFPMRLLLPLAWCLAAHLAIAVAATATTAEAADAPLTPIFDWPAPATIAVTSNVLKKGRTAQVRFNLVTERDRGDGSIFVTLKDFDFVRFDGDLVDTPEEKAALAPVLALTSIVPGFEVSKDGQLISLVDFDWDLIMSEMRAFIRGQTTPDP
ncbi:MAG: hypothetical protein ACE5JZ_09985 [Kiloniellales bacterium]